MVIRSISSYILPCTIKTSIKQKRINTSDYNFSHGYGGTAERNTYHCEELASHGYIVIGISHTYENNIVQFPDGRIADGKKTSAKKVYENKNFIERRKQNIHKNKIRVADVSFIIDKIEQLNKNKGSIFHKHLDMKNIGIFGQSKGGNTPAIVCQDNSRVKCGVDMD